MHRCREKSMIPARVQPNHGRAREATDAIGFKPFARGREVKVVKNVFGQVDHDLPECASSGMSSRGFIPRSRTVVNWTRSFENSRSRVQSSATRHFFSNRGSLLR